MLTAMQVAKMKTAGVFRDDRGLYLQVTIGARGPGLRVNKSWLFRYQVNGKARSMGLGAYPAVGLAEARGRRDEARKVLNGGVDPIEARDRKRVEAAGRKTFGECAAGYISAHEGSWSNAKHRGQWRATLTAHCKPLWARPVDEIDVKAVLECLTPIWQDKPETASRLRGRIEAVLDDAMVKGLRHGNNPARWKGNLRHALPKPAKLSRGHHAAMSYAEVPAFMAQLRQREGIAALALEFLILTAARTGEAIGARWGEFDLEANLWTVPASRMKAGREHRVPLSDGATSVLDRLPRFPADDRVFPVSNMALAMLLRRMGRGGITVHGFRSSFRDWVAECMNFPSEVAEMALAHAVGSKVEAAYRRGDLFAKRRDLAEAWAAFCEQKPANVTQLHAG